MSQRRIIIAGGGRVGLATARILSERGHTVVIIDENEERCEQISGEYVAQVINGDATDPSVLKQGKIESCDAIGAVTDDAETNIAITMVARRFSPDIYTLIRTTSEGKKKYEGLVDSVIIPEQETANLTADILSGGNVRTLVGKKGVDDIEILEVIVDEDTPMAGEKLENISMPDGSIVISDSDRRQIAGPDTVIEGGKRYVLGVEKGVADEVKRMFGI